MKKMMTTRIAPNVLQTARSVAFVGVALMLGCGDVAPIQTKQTTRAMGTFNGYTNMTASTLNGTGDLERNYFFPGNPVIEADGYLFMARDVTGNPETGAIYVSAPAGTDTALAVDPEQ